MKHSSLILKNVIRKSESAAEFQNKDKLAPQFRERLATLSLLSPAPAQHALGPAQHAPAAGGSDRLVHAGAELLALLPQLHLVL